MVDRQLASEEWYHGLLPREDIKLMLRKNGEFLVRTTEPGPGRPRSFVLSVMYDQSKEEDGIKNFVLNKNDMTGKFVLDKYAFPSIPAMIDYLIKHKESVTPAYVCKISSPVNRLYWELNHEDVELTKKLGEGAFGEVHMGKLKTKRGKGKEVAVAVKLGFGVMEEEDTDQLGIFSQDLFFSQSSLSITPPPPSIDVASENISVSAITSPPSIDVASENVSVSAITSPPSIDVASENVYPSNGDGVFHIATEKVFIDAQETESEGNFLKTYYDLVERQDSEYAMRTSSTSIASVLENIRRSRDASEDQIYLWSPTYPSFMGLVEPPALKTRSRDNFAFDEINRCTPPQPTSWSTSFCSFFLSTDAPTQVDGVDDIQNGDQEIEGQGRGRVDGREFPSNRPIDDVTDVAPLNDPYIFVDDDPVQPRVPTEPSLDDILGEDRISINNTDTRQCEEEDESSGVPPRKRVRKNRNVAAPSSHKLRRPAGVQSTDSDTTDLLLESSPERAGTSASKTKFGPYRPNLMDMDISSPHEEFLLTSKGIRFWPLESGCLMKYVATLSDGSLSLRCLDKQCAGTARRRGEDIEIRKACSKVHIPDTAKVEAMKLMSWGKAMKMQGMRAMLVCKHLRKRASDEALRYMPALENLARPLHRACSPSALDNLPLICSGQEAAFMYNGCSILIFNDTDSAPPGLGLVILGNSGASEALTRGCGHLFLDGERKRNPRSYYQCYNIGTYLDGHYFHLFVCFLQCATEEVYSKMLTTLQLTHSFENITATHMDFELGMVNAIKKTLPNAAVHLCIFHLQQAMLFQFSQKGLNMQSKTACEIAQLLLSLRFVPFDEARVAFHAICALIAGVDDADKPGVRSCLRYVARTYIGWTDRSGTSRNPRFSPVLWSIHERVLQSTPLTNNASEVQNSHFGQFCPQRHPTMSSYLFAVKEMWDKMEEDKRHANLDSYQSPDALPSPSGFAKKVAAILAKPRDPTMTDVEYLKRFRPLNKYGKIVEGLQIHLD